MRLKLLIAMLFVAALLTEIQAQKKTPAVQRKTSTVAKKPVAKKPVASTPQKLPVTSAERMVEITTDFGTMVAKLYDSTPLHRDNFVKLVQQGFYDSLLFHRVIENFMIQGGDPTSKNASDSAMLGTSNAPGDRIPAEVKPYLFHKKGALAAARDNNPTKASSNSQFYIVQGKKLTEQEIDNYYTSRVLPNNPNFKYTPQQREIYTRIGGTPFLDQGYTVFGEVISGLDVIDKIAKVAKGQADRPVQNVRMKIRMVN